MTYVKPFMRDYHLILKSPFYFYQVFPAGTSAFALRKIVKLAININVATATSFVDKKLLLY